MARVVDRLSPAFHHSDEFVEMDGFAKEIVHALGDAIVPVLSGGIGGHGDDYRLMTSASPDLAGGLQAVHFGHLDVHKDEVEGFFLELFQYFFSIFCDSCRVAHFVKDENGQLPVDGVVFCQQDAERIFFCQPGEGI